MKGFKLRLYASILSILLILASPLLKKIVEISDTVLISIITTIGAIAGTFMVIQHKREKTIEESQNATIDQPY